MTINIFFSSQTASLLLPNISSKSAPNELQDESYERLAEAVFERKPTENDLDLVRSIYFEWKKPNTSKKAQQGTLSKKIKKKGEISKKQKKKQTHKASGRQININFQ